MQSLRKRAHAVGGPRFQVFPPSLAPAPRIRGKRQAFVCCPAKQVSRQTSSYASKPTVREQDGDVLDSSGGGSFPVLSQPSARLSDVSDSGGDRFSFSPVPDLLVIVEVGWKYATRDIPGTLIYICTRFHSKSKLVHVKLQSPTRTPKGSTWSRQRSSLSPRSLPVQVESSARLPVSAVTETPLGTCCYPHRASPPPMLLHPLQYPETTWMVQTKMHPKNKRYLI